MDGSDTDGFVWKIGKDTVDKILQYLEHPIGGNRLLPRNYGEHLVVRFARLFLLE